MTPYTAYPNIQGIIYQDDMDRNRLMRTEELYKFSNGTLNHVRTALNDITIGIQMEYLPKRNWKSCQGDSSKLNLPKSQGRSSRIRRILKDGGEVKEFQRSFRHSDTERLSQSDEVLKLKNFKKDATLKLSKLTNQEWYEHVGPEVTRSQDDKVTRWRNEIMLS
ncbi:hypothetical protein Tco_1340619 [Tanacetum coccineum]